MKININDSDKIVEIWLTQEEKADAALRASLKPIYSIYKKKKYTVAVFESGDKSLFEYTKDLLLHNRTATANA